MTQSNGRSQAKRSNKRIQEKINKAFLEENVRNFDPNDDSQFFRYVSEITDSKRAAGATASGNIEIPGNGDYGSEKIYDAPDEYFDIVDNEEK